MLRESLARFSRNSRSSVTISFNDFCWRLWSSAGRNRMQSITANIAMKTRKTPPVKHLRAALFNGLVKLELIARVDPRQPARCRNARDVRAISACVSTFAFFAMPHHHKHAVPDIHSKHKTIVANTAILSQDVRYSNSGSVSAAT
jgi:hypothetical protein